MRIERKFRLTLAVLGLLLLSGLSAYADSIVITPGNSATFTFSQLNVATGQSLTGFAVLGLNAAGTQMTITLNNTYQPPLGGTNLFPSVSGFGFDSTPNESFVSGSGTFFGQMASGW